MAALPRALHGGGDAVDAEEDVVPQLLPIRLVPILAGLATSIAVAFAPAVVIAFANQIKALWVLMAAHPFVAIAAIVSGLAPGRLALTWMVGKSTVGRSLTGSARYATRPKIRMPTMTSVVMTGRRMNSSVKLMWPP